MNSLYLDIRVSLILLITCVSLCVCYGYDTFFDVWRKIHGRSNDTGKPGFSGACFLDDSRAVCSRRFDFWSCKTSCRGCRCDVEFPCRSKSIYQVPLCVVVLMAQNNLKNEEEKKSEYFFWA